MPASSTIILSNLMFLANILRDNVVQMTIFLSKISLICLLNGTCSFRIGSIPVGLPVLTQNFSAVLPSILQSSQPNSLAAPLVYAAT